MEYILYIRQLILIGSFCFISMMTYGSIVIPDQGITPLMKVCRSGKLRQVKKVTEAGANINAISKGYRRTALTYAINDNIQSAPIVDYLLKHGAKIEIKDIDKNNALLNCLLKFSRIYGNNKQPRIAALRKTAWLLLNAGAKTGLVNNQGETALTAASRWLDAGFIAELLKHKVDISAHVNDSGETALIRALQNNNIHVVKLLLAHGATPDERDYNNTAAIFFAKNLVAVKLLLAKGAKLDCRRITSSRCSSDFFKVLKSVSILDDWARWADLKLIKLALDEHCPVTVEALVAAVENIKNPGVLPLLLKHYKSKEKLPLEIMLNKAAQRANVSGIKLLLEQGAKPNSISCSGRTPLMNICLNSDFPAKRCKIIKLLLQGGAGVNIADTQGKTALMLATGKASIEIVKTLLVVGAAVNASDQQGRTALLTLIAIPYYCNPKSLLLLELLLKYKSDLNAKDNNDASALLLALGHQQKPAVIKRLLELNVSINSVSKNRISPLMLAARHYDAEIVDLLLKRGAKVNATDDTGWTPLMYAAEYWPLQRGCSIYPVPVCRNRKSPQESIKLLIKHGAKVNVSDKYGNTSLIEAAGWADADTLKLLLPKDKSLLASWVNAQNVAGHTALMCAIAHNPDDKAIKVLIDAGAKCEVSMKRGRHPSRNKRKIADGLVSASKQSYEWIDPPLFVAVARGKKAIVKELLKYGADPNWQYSGRGSNLYTPLYNCKDTAIATLLIKAGAIKSSLDSSTSSNLLNSIKYQKFEQACQSEPLVVLEKMLKALNFQNKKIGKQMLNRAQRCAIRSNNLKVVKWLFKKGARFTQSIIINAVENADNPDMLKYLFKHGLTTKYRTNYDYRPKGALHFACSAEIVDILIKNGMNVNERAGKSRRGLTPLQAAVSRPWHQHSWQRATVVEALLKHGAKLEQTDPDGRTALLIAFSHKYLSPAIAVVKILLNYGAKVNTKDRQGHSALNYAVDKNDCYFTDMLLAAGAATDLITQKELNKACPYIKWKIDQACSKQK